MNEDAAAYLSNEVIPCIKGLAFAKIVAFLPTTTQSNMNARMNELNDARFSRALTADEQAEIESMRGAWTKARGIRDVSNTHEAALRKLTTLEEVKSYDYRAGWPV